MPDLNAGRKLTSKNEAVKKFETSARSSHSSNIKGGEKRKSERGSARSPPRRRANRRSRSSSSETSNSSSSRSGSADSSDSDSSHSPKRSQKTPAQSKNAKGSERSKAAPQSHSSKPESTATSAKSEDVRSLKEPPKKPIPSADAAKPAESTRTDLSIKNKPTANALAEESQSNAHLPQSVKTVSGAITDKSDPSKSQSVAKPSTKPSKPVAVDTEKVSRGRSKSPVSIPPFNRVLVEKLTRNVNKAHVTEIFSVWGEIVSVEMPSDRLHPEFSRSYAYVTYSNPKCAADAVNFMNGGQIDGETIRVTEIFSRPNASVSRAGADSVTTDSSQYRDRDATKRDFDKTADSGRGLKDTTTPAARDTDDNSERPRDRSGLNDLDRRRDLRDKDRRDRERERDRQRDRSREFDRPRRARRGSSGSPFASRSGAAARQRSPVAGSRYRRASPLSTRPDITSRRGRSRSPKPLTKPGVTSRSGADSKSSGTRRGRNTARSSSSSSSDSASSNSSSSSSRSGSTSSSSGSSSSRSRS